MAIDDNRLKTIISDLKGMGVSLSDVEKEVNMRNKWGKMQNNSMRSYTTEDLSEAIKKWMQY